MTKLLKYFKGYGAVALLAPAFKLLEASFELFVPFVVARIIDYGIGTGNRAYAFRMSLVLVLLSFVGLISTVIAQYFAAKASVGFASKVRTALFSRIQSMSYTELDRAGTSTLITRMTSDINQLQSGVNLTLRLFLRSPFIVFGAMIMAFTIDFRSALIFVGMIAVLSVIVFGIMLISIPLYRRVQDSLDGMTAITRENLTGIRILRGFCKEDDEKREFAAAAERLRRGQLFVGRISALMNPLTCLVVNVSVILLIRSGAFRVDSGAITQGQLVALYNYMAQILVELIKLANLIITITKAAACADRVADVITSGDGERSGGKRLPQDVSTSVPKVEFRGVSLRYDGSAEDSLHGITFSVMPGETVGIIGGTGSGKTSLVNLIPAFYECTEGEVLVDGVNVTECDIDSLRKRIGIVPQRAVLFKGSIRDNLLWRDPRADDAELMSAAADAMADDVIKSKDGGLSAHVEQSGRNFSGGQRQRLTIARALVGHPDILIFDDSSSALDYATDAALRRSIANLPYTHTTFIVSQRTSSIMHADRIIVLENGVPVGIGTHDELYRTCDTYREIHDLQFREAVSENE